MNKLVCPLCDKEVTKSPFKTWKFRGYDVKRYECQNCKSKFNVYQSPKKTFTIPSHK